MSSFSRLMVIVIVACWGLGCEDESDFRSQPPEPTQVLPPSGYSHGGADGATAAAACDLSKPSGYCRIESDRPLSIEQMLGHARRQSADVEVEVVSSAVVLAGMRYSPEQQPGEVAVNRWVTGGGYEPWWPNGNHPNNTWILNHNGSWPTLGSSAATWASGSYMDNNIKQASFWVPSGKCVGFRVYADENWVSKYSFLGEVVCKTQHQGLENWLLWDQNWQVSSMKTGFSNCFVPNNCPLPPGF